MTFLIFNFFNALIVKKKYLDNEIYLSDWIRKAGHESM